MATGIAKYSCRDAGAESTLIGTGLFENPETRRLSDPQI
jgi:hypothetical protein